MKSVTIFFFSLEASSDAVCFISLCILFQQLHYSFNKFLLFQEPLLVFGAFYLLFMLVIIYMRMDFAISKVRFIRCCSNTGVFPTRSEPRCAAVFFNLHFALNGVIAKNELLLSDIFIS